MRKSRPKPNCTLNSPTDSMHRKIDRIVDAESETLVARLTA